MQTVKNKTLLTELAKESMVERDLLPYFAPAIVKQVKELERLPPIEKNNLPSSLKDLRHWPWFSLDNEDSLDLDQITYAEKKEDNSFTLYVAIADVDSLVKKGSPIDQHAAHNTTSVYTPTQIFPMLPEALSTGLTSLNEGEDRLAIVCETTIDTDGSIKKYELYPACVRNRAKLDYNSVSAWLESGQEPPPKLAESQELRQQVELQDTIASILRLHRQKRGALTLQTIEAQAIFHEESVTGLKVIPKNRGRNLIEDFMITANESTALFLKEHQRPSLKRVVRTPKLWERIVEIAKEKGALLPLDPCAIALEKFLSHQSQVDPLHFPDLSLTIIKLLGRGEYVIESPGESSLGHFSLAVKNYMHSTAPNRRFPDLIAQRLVKSVLYPAPSPYSHEELEKLAKHCTEKEDDADKVERKMRKSAACLLLASQINHRFEALVTGSGPKGTWVRLFDPPVEGKLIRGFEGVKIGQKIDVQLVLADVTRGFIDFIRLTHS